MTFKWVAMKFNWLAMNLKRSAHPYSWAQWTWTAAGFPTVKWERGRQGGRVTQYARNKVMYVTTRTRYVENANGHVRKTKATSGKQRHCTTNDMVASAEKRFAKMAHTPFLSKRFLKSTGERFGSDTLSDWCMQRDFGRLTGYMLPIQTRAFLC